MTLEEIKIQWNKNLERIKKAEKVAVENPDLFEKFIDEYNTLCRKMSRLMSEYEIITGKEISQSVFDNGFNLN